MSRNRIVTGNTMNRRLLLIAGVLLAGVVAAPTTSAAQRSQPEGWFIGGGISMFELNGSGDVITSDGRMRFSVERRNAYGLVTNRRDTAEERLGLGWENTQMPGAKLVIGYRHNFHFLTHLDLFWGLPKAAELQGYPDPNDTTGQYLQKQSTEWRQSSTRLALDWTPFEPLPLWYFTAGFEYVRFRSRLEFRFEFEEDNGGRTIREFETYEETGSGFGVVVGTGLQLASKEQRSMEWFVSLNYAWVPYNANFYAWDGEFLIGGASLEGGLRVYVGGGE
ncbi:MAG: hypothetical protein MAG453_00601 [Calditrichaeota bacterium]|nr:hypothetical protein [Calditrichota bacterium]